MLYSALTNEELLRQLGGSGHDDVVKEVICRFPALMTLETAHIKQLESDLDTAEDTIARLSRGECCCNN